MDANPPFLGPDGGDLLTDEYCKPFFECRVLLYTREKKDEANGVSQMHNKEKPPSDVNQNRWHIYEIYLAVEVNPPIRMFS